MSIDDGQIDEDHKQLISIANRVLELNHPNRELEDIKQVIRELYEYVKYHFEREERFMSEQGFPGVDEHKEKHEIIIAEMNQYLTKAHHMGEILSNFRQLVNKWVINHIMEEDKNIKIFLKAKKQSQP